MRDLLNAAQPQPDIGYSGQDFALHDVPYAYMQRISLAQVAFRDNKAILVAANAVPKRNSLIVCYPTRQSIADKAMPWLNKLVYDQHQIRKRKLIIDPKPHFLPVEAG